MKERLENKMIEIVYPNIPDHHTISMYFGLARVLSVLNQSEDFYYNYDGYDYTIISYDSTGQINIPRQLLDDNGNEMGLFEQDEQTQISIANLLGYEK